MNNEKWLNELKRIFPDHDHVFVDNQLKLDEWKKQNSPYTWILEIEHDNIQIYDDVGYGHLLMIIDGKIINHGRNFVSSIGSDYIAMTEYYTGDEDNPVILYKKIDKKGKKK